MGGAAQYVLWTVEAVGAWISPRLIDDSGFQIAPTHFVERHGLVVIVEGVDGQAWSPERRSAGQRSLRELVVATKVSPPQTRAQSEPEAGHEDQGQVDGEPLGADAERDDRLPDRDYRETTGDPDVQAIHRGLQDEAGAALGAILGSETGAENIAGSADQQALEMAAEVMRAGLTGLAIWWTEHPDVPRERIVATAINVIWIGFERVRRGEVWPPSSP